MGGKKLETVEYKQLFLEVLLQSRVNKWDSTRQWKWGQEKVFLKWEK